MIPQLFGIDEGSGHLTTTSEIAPVNSPFIVSQVLVLVISSLTQYFLVVVPSVNCS